MNSTGPQTQGRMSVTIGQLAILALLSLNTAACEAQTRQHPNVLFIFLDDLGWTDLSVMGSDYYETPHLDKIAAAGMRFTDAYACAANCAPSRACLLSGQYTPRHEIYNVGTTRRGSRKHGKLLHIPGTKTLRTDIVTWAHAIQQAGYKTATMGKWHLSDDPRPYGFDVNIGGTHSGGPPRGYFPPHGNVPGLQNAPRAEYVTDRLTDEAIKFIRVNQKSPWFLYLTHFAVHTPLQARADLLKLYQQKDPGKHHQSAVMAAMIHSVDSGVGRLVATLNELKLTEKTAIFFFSDNGGFGPATSMHPLKGYKGTYYEGGIRVPLFVKWPGIVAAGSRCSEPVIGVDLYPTFCEMTGAKLPENQPVDGISLVDLLTGRSRSVPRGLFWHFPAYLQSYSRIDQQRDPLYRSRPCSIIRLGDWKLHEYFEDGGLELYDLRNDPGESRNLAEQQPHRTRLLHERLRQWRADVKAPVPNQPNPNYDAKAERDAIQRLQLRQQKRSKTRKT
ncbi:MAG: sulfatase [Planctomycetaceae bacterium]